MTKARSRYYRGLYGVAAAYDITLGITLLSFASSIGCRFAGVGSQEN